MLYSPLSHSPLSTLHSSLFTLHSPLSTLHSSLSTSLSRVSRANGVEQPGELQALLGIEHRHSRVVGGRDVRVERREHLVAAGRDVTDHLAAIGFLALAADVSRFLEA